MLYTQDPDIQSMLKKVSENKKGIWLRPLTASLRPVGSHMICHLEDHTDAVAVTTDGQPALSASNGILTIWDMKNGDKLRTIDIHNNQINRVALKDDGKYAISISNDGTLTVWYVETHEPLRTIKIYDDRFSEVVLTNDLNYALVASGEGTLIIWDTKTWELVHTLEDYTGPVTAVSLA